MSAYVDRIARKISKMSDEQIVQLLESMHGDIELRDTVLDAADEGYLLVDARGNVAYSNRAVGTLFRTDSVSSRRHSLETTVRNEDTVAFMRSCIDGTAKELQKHIKVVFDGDELLYEVKMLRRLDSLCLFNVTDISNFREFIEKFRKNEALARMTILSSQVAHEIKNPLGAISIYVQLLEKVLGKNGSISKEDAQQYLGVIKEEIENLNKIAVDFLYAVKPMDVSLYPLDLNGVVESTLKLMSVELERNGIRLVCNPANSLPLVLADSTLVGQSLLNLVKNAEQAMTGGKGIVTISTYVDGGSVCISVQDNGCGMTEEQMSRIFEPYYTTKESGSGLGLTVIYKIMKEHGGDVRVSSVKDEGSTFVLEFPVRPEDRYRIV